MSDNQGNIYSDEEKYANDSFETDFPESSICGSDDDETTGGRKLMVASNKSKTFGHNNDFWTCESSSDEDDVVLGHTIAEINTDPGEIDEDNLSLTPAARVFKMASAKRNSQRIEEITDDDDELTECEDFDDGIDDIDEVDETMIPTDADAEIIFQRYTKLSTEDEIIYKDLIMFDTNNVDVVEVYTDIGTEDGGEVDIGEPNLCEELGEEEEVYEEEPHDEISDEDKAGYSNAETIVTASEDDDDDEKTIGAVSLVSQSLHDELPVDTKSESRSEPKSEVRGEPKSETKSLRTDDSMEDFKRKVMLSQRIRCGSDGSGDHVRLKQRKSGIPIWVGSNERLDKLDALKTSHSAPGVRSMIPIPDTRSHNSLPDFSDAETLTPVENDDVEVEFDRLAGGDYNDFMTDGFISEYADIANGIDDGTSAYSMRMEMFMDSNEIPQKQKKLRAGERRNKSFSNERLRDIERHNHILLHKILNQKPTYILDEKKKKKDKFATLPPTTRITSAEINRKKQQRQIDMDNQLLKRKLEAIAKRKPKTKQK